MAQFSRLQLAAALIEYDNDPTNPDAPFRSAHDSALFAPLRRRRRSQSVSRKSPDFLGVSLPSDAPESGRATPLGSGDGGRKPRNSIVAMKNPFSDEGPDSDDVRYNDGDTEEGEDMEVDLSSWGLDSFVAKEKEPMSARSQAFTAPLSDPHAMRSWQQNVDISMDTQQRKPGTRSLSLSAMDSLWETPASATDAVAERKRRISLGSPYASADSTQTRPLRNRHISSHALIQVAPGDSGTIPFPSTRREDEFEAASLLQLGGSRERALSIASIRPSLLEESNTFAIRPPSPDRASRFDPKVARPRSLSAGSKELLNDDNPFELRPPSVMSKFDPKSVARVRTESIASMSSRPPLDGDRGPIVDGSTYRRHTTLDLLRPKVLIMPSPLQDVRSPTPPPTSTILEGFQLTTDGPPLPPGARSARSLSAFEPALAVPPTSNLLPANPRSSLTLSQLTFRNSLMVGGQRDVAYVDIERRLPRASEEGEQARPSSPISEDEETPAVTSRPTEPAPRRPAGKLYGKSLVDDLEQRKTQLRSKQRVFTGDNRPSMMARAGHSIDSETLQASVAPPGSLELTRQNASGHKPLVDLEQDGRAVKIPATARMRTTRSVFGVDTIWEHEMEKLREIERLEAEEAKRKALEEEAKESKQKKKGKGKGKQRETSDAVEEVPPQVEEKVPTRAPTMSPIPMIARRGPPPRLNDDDESGDDKGADTEIGIRLVGAPAKAANWDSSDEEVVGPRRTTGTGPRYPKAAQKRPPAPAEDSDEDVPLSVALEKVVRRVAGSNSADPDSDDEPLSLTLSKAKLRAEFTDSRPLVSLPAADNGGRDDGDDDDDKPLALRLSVATSQALNVWNGGDDDDVPLAFHPAQQRQTQYMFAQQQQQQQQMMMMQAQMQNGMFFGSTTSLVAPGFVGPPMGGPMMMMMPAPPMPIPSPPPQQDTRKYVQVNQWRHNVAVEGQQ